MVISNPLSASSIYYDPWHPPCLNYVTYSFFPQSLQVFFGLPFDLAPSTSYSIHLFTNHCLLFAVHAYTIATCFAAVPRLCHLILVSLKSQPFTWNSISALHPTVYAPPPVLNILFHPCQTANIRRCSTTKPRIGPHCRQLHLSEQPRIYSLGWTWVAQQ